MGWWRWVEQRWRRTRLLILSFHRMILPWLLFYEVRGGTEGDEIDWLVGVYLLFIATTWLLSMYLHGHIKYLHFQ